MGDIIDIGMGATVREGTSGALKRPRDGSKLKKRWKTAELRSMLADVKRLLGEGKPDHEIAEELLLTAGAYNDLKKELYRQETAEMYNLTTEDVYLEYKWRQMQCIKELDAVIELSKKEDNHNAALGAIRTKSDIIDKLVKIGQSMGVLDSAPERKLITNEMQGLRSVMAKYGDADMSGKPIEPAALEVPAGPEFTDKAKPGKAMGGKAKVLAGKAGAKMKRVKSVAPDDANR